MANIKPEEIIGENGATLGVAWKDVKPGDTVIPYKCAAKPDKTLHVYGDYTGSYAGSLQGSNDSRAQDPAQIGSASFVSVKDASGTNLSFTANGYALIIPNFMYWRPAVANGSGAAALNFVMTFV